MYDLAIQEYDFQIVYCKGSLNANADALSRLHTSPCAVTVAMSHYSAPALRIAQQDFQGPQAHLHSRNPPKGQEWNQHPFQLYRQLWAQLRIIDGVLCQHVTLSPMAGAVLVPILPAALCQEGL